MKPTVAYRICSTQLLNSPQALLLMVKFVDDNICIALVNTSLRMSCNGIQALGIDFGSLLQS